MWILTHFLILISSFACFVILETSLDEKFSVVSIGPRHSKILKESVDLALLQDLSENELEQLLVALDNEEENTILDVEDYEYLENILFNKTQDIDDLGPEILEYLDIDDDDENQNQSQQQSQSFAAEIHAHNNIYIFIPSNKTLLPINSIPSFLELLSLNPNLFATVTPPYSTTSQTCQPATSTQQPETTSEAPGTGGSHYGGNQELAEGISLTTSVPTAPPRGTTTQRTTLPPVDPVPPNSGGQGLSSGQVVAPEIAPVDPLITATSDTSRATTGVTSCGDTSALTTLNFINPDYPSSTSQQGDCILTLEVQPGVCQVRVDFVDTELSQPKLGVCSDQRIIVGGDIWPLGVQSFCGNNAGQHFYIEMKNSGASRRVYFVVRSSSTEAFKFGLWITQINCDGTSRFQAPSGCFQYYPTSYGVLSSFNYGGNYYVNQHYRICIKSAESACDVVFIADGPFMIEKFGNFKTFPYTRAGVTSSYCVRDFLLIPCARQDFSTVTHDRYCGGQLSYKHGDTESRGLVASITGSIISLEFHTENTLGNYIEDHHKPGFKIRYTQTSSSCKG